MRHIRWVGVILGVAVTILLQRLLFTFVDSVIATYLHGIFAVERPGGVTSFTGRNWAIYESLNALLFLFALLLAFFVGGLVVGGVVRGSPGLNGAVSGAVVAAVGFAWLVGPVIPWIFMTPRNPGEAATQAENLTGLIGWIVVFSAVSSFAVGAGYFGAKLGARLRSRAVTRSET